MKPRFAKGPLFPTSRLFSAGLAKRASEFYSIAEDGASITCCICGFASVDPRDVREKYCPVCRVFHEDRMLMARLAEGYETRYRWRRPADLRWKTAR